MTKSINIKNISTKAVASACLALSMAVASPAVFASSGDTAAKTVNVKFAKGASSANYHGKISGYDYQSYKFYAKAGQKLKVKLSGGNVYAMLFHAKLADSVNVNEYSPALDSNGAYKLPYSGQYELRILQPRSAGQQGKTAQYWLEIAIR